MDYQKPYKRLCRTIVDTGTDIDDKIAWDKLSPASCVSIIKHFYDAACEERDGAWDQLDATEALLEQAMDTLEAICKHAHWAGGVYGHGDWRYVEAAAQGMLDLKRDVGV